MASRVSICFSRFIDTIVWFVALLYRLPHDLQKRSLPHRKWQRKKLNLLRSQARWRSWLVEVFRVPKGNWFHSTHLLECRQFTASEARCLCQLDKILWQRTGDWGGGRAIGRIQPPSLQRLQRHCHRFAACRKCWWGALTWRVKRQRCL